MLLASWSLHCLMCFTVILFSNDKVLLPVWWKQNANAMVFFLFNCLSSLSTYFVPSTGASMSASSNVTGFRHQEALSETADCSEVCATSATWPSAGGENSLVRDKGRQTTPFVTFSIVQDMGSHCREINHKILTIIEDLMARHLSRVRKCRFASCCC